MIEIIIISVLSLLVVVLGFTTFNLLNKTEKYEDLAKYYADLFIQMDSFIELSNKRIQEIDEKGSFRSDDEIGWFFEQIKYIQEVFNKFKENL